MSSVCKKHFLISTDGKLEIVDCACLLHKLNSYVKYMQYKYIKEDDSSYLREGLFYCTANIALGCVYVLKKYMHLICWFNINTQGYFASCVVFFRAPKGGGKIRVTS